MKKKPLDLRAIFRRHMKWKGMNQTQVADMLGVSRQYISGYLNGRFNISHDHLERLLEYFDLIKDDDIKERPKNL